MGTELSLHGEYQVSETADRLSRRAGFTISRADIMSCHDLIAYESRGIRNVTAEDFFAYWDIWETSYRRMLISLGIPVSLEAPTVTEHSDKEKEAAIKEFIANTSDKFVVEVNGKIVGMGEIFGDHIGALAVALEEQGHGFGTRLTAYLTNEILRRGYEKAILYCEHGNDNAKRVYEKVGYVVEETIASVSRTMRV